MLVQLQLQPCKVGGHTWVDFAYWWIVNMLTIKLFDILNIYNGCTQTLPNAATPEDKIHPITKNTVTFEPIMQI